ncbi:hypothetical protein [Lactobacillus delbrueckii]|nr:hypothetical protein [Lactobacillus delbrueckii]
MTVVTTDEEPATKSAAKAPTPVTKSANKYSTSSQGSSCSSAPANR